MRFVLIAFAVLGVAWYELSGGADFVPGDVSVQVFAPAQRAVRLYPASPPVPVPGPPPREARAATQRQVAPPETPPAITGSAGWSARDGLARIATDPDQGPEVAETAAAPPERQPDATRLVATDRVPLHAGPGRGHGIVLELLEGEAVSVVVDDGSGWVRLRVHDGGATGWARAADLRLPAAE